MCVCCPACPSGRFGENCHLHCECGGGSCDPTTGRCLCPAGKTGASCQQGVEVDETKLNTTHCLVCVCVCVSHVLAALQTALMDCGGWSAARLVPTVTTEDPATSRAACATARQGSKVSAARQVSLWSVYNDN